VAQVTVVFFPFLVLVTMIARPKTRACSVQTAKVGFYCKRLRSRHRLRCDQVAGGVMADRFVLLRVPPSSATDLQKQLSSGATSSFAIQWNTPAQGLFHDGKGVSLPFRLDNLPCPVSVLKKFPNKLLYDCGTLSQMITVSSPASSSCSSSASSVAADPLPRSLASGITPPAHEIARRRVPPGTLTDDEFRHTVALMQAIEFKRDIHEFELVEVEIEYDDDNSGAAAPAAVARPAEAPASGKGTRAASVLQEQQDDSCDDSDDEEDEEGDVGTDTSKKPRAAPHAIPPTSASAAKRDKMGEPAMQPLPRGDADDDVAAMDEEEVIISTGQALLASPLSAAVDFARAATTASVLLSSSSGLGAHNPSPFVLGTSSPSPVPLYDPLATPTPDLAAVPLTPQLLSMLSASPRSSSRLGLVESPLTLNRAVSVGSFSSHGGGAGVGDLQAAQAALRVQIGGGGGAPAAAGAPPSPLVMPSSVLVSSSSGGLMPPMPPLSSAFNASGNGGSGGGGGLFPASPAVMLTGATGAGAALASGLKFEGLGPREQQVWTTCASMAQSQLQAFIIQETKKLQSANRILQKRAQLHLDIASVFLLRQA
jgi:hypothetical protein